MKNKITLIKDDDLKVKVFLNGKRLFGVSELRYNKTSAYDKTEVVIKIDVDELIEIFK